jgi:CBS domain-containing protein
MAIEGTTPLIALDAVVIDSETTSLDPRKARIVEIAAVRLAAGRLQIAPSYQRRIRPDIPIPPEATRIHGIDDSAVRDAPSFAEAWPELAVKIAGGVVLGHAIGFDLAVLERECARAGIAWQRPRTLDTRLLAQVAETDLPGYSLGNLTAWLGIEPVGRHTAFGDALTTARIFLALQPKLRDAGIRTLAEAERACRALTTVLDAQHRAGWAEAVAVPHESAPAISRIESYAYRHRISDVMSSPAKFVTAEVPVGKALRRMTDERISSLFVVPSTGANPPHPQETGILVERDIVRLVAKDGANALEVPVDAIASRPLATVPADALAYLAIGRMRRLKIRHLGVTDERGLVIGALSARDLLRVAAEGAVSLGDEIEQAADVPELGLAWAKLPRVCQGLLTEGLSACEIAALISQEINALTARAATLAEVRMQAAGRGSAPCSYTVAVLGSAARGESLLALDQDNALVFADSAPEAEADRWFETFGGHLADILHDTGVPYCPGGVMAKNPQWRGSVATWRERVRGWVRRSGARDLLSVDTFFDLRGVQGDIALADAVWREGFDIAKGDAAFAKLLTESAGSVRPGLGLFGGFKTEQGRLDLKRTGLFGIVTAARALAVCHHIVERSTPARLEGVEALGLGGGRDLDALIEAQGVFLDLILFQQVMDIRHGKPASNAVETKKLQRRDAERLRAALRAVTGLEELTRDLLFSQ